MECPAGAFLVKNETCVSCIANCFKCSADISCQVCQIGFNLINGRCLKTEQEENYFYIEVLIAIFLTVVTVLGIRWLVLTYLQQKKLQKLRLNALERQYRGESHVNIKMQSGKANFVSFNFTDDISTNTIVSSDIGFTNIRGSQKQVKNRQLQIKQEKQHGWKRMNVNQVNCKDASQRCVDRFITEEQQTKKDQPKQSMQICEKVIISTTTAFCEP